jgi:hypothetical protein
MLALELPHWLIVAGSALVMAGLIGLGLNRNKQIESDPLMLPGDLNSWRSERADASAPVGTRDLG